MFHIVIDWTLLIDARPKAVFEKSHAKNFSVMVPLPEKHMLSTGNKTIKVFQKGFPVITQQQVCHSNGLTHFKCSGCNIDEYISQV